MVHKKKIMGILLLIGLIFSLFSSAWLALGEGKNVGVNDFFETSSLALEENISGNSLKESGGEILFPNENKIGVKVSGETGGTLSIKNQIKGAFEIDFRVWADEIGVPQLKKLALIFDDGTNSFSVHLEHADTNVTQVPAARVSVNGGADKYAYQYINQWNDVGYVLNSYRCNSYGTPIFGTTFSNPEMVRFLPGTNQPYWNSESTKIGFDPQTMEVYTYLINFNTKQSVKVPVWKLNETKSFSGPAPTEEVKTIQEFGEAYNVKIEFEEVEVGKTGQALIYFINGLSMATSDGELGAAIPHIVGIPSVGENLTEGMKLELPEPLCYDIVNENYAFEGTVTAMLNGDPVEIAGLSESFYQKGCYINLQSGEYTITYIPIKSGQTGDSKSITFTVEEDVAVSNKVLGDLFASKEITISETSVKGNTLKDSNQTVLFPDESKSGVMFTSQTGGTVQVINEISGVFEIDFRVWAEQTMLSGEWGNFADTNAYNTREVAITINDGVNVFTIHIVAGDAWKAIMPTAYVSYGNSADRYAMKYSDTTGAFENYRVNGYGTWLFGTSFVNRARGFATFLDSAKSISNKIGFDPVTMEVYAYALKPGNTEVQKYVIWELDQKATSFAGVNNSEQYVSKQPVITSFSTKYSVEISMAVQNGKIGQMMVYSLNGQEMRTASSGKIVNTAGPKLALKPLVLPGVVGEFYDIPEVEYLDFLDGKVVANNIQIIDPNGQPIELEEGIGFTPFLAGEYTITYAVSDAQGLEGENSVIKVTVDDAEKYPEPGEGDIPEGNDPPKDPEEEKEEPGVVVPEKGDVNPDKLSKWAVIGIVVGGVVVLSVASFVVIEILKKKNR